MLGTNRALRRAFVLFSTIYINFDKCLTLWVWRAGGGVLNFCKPVQTCKIALSRYMQVLSTSMFGYIVNKIGSKNSKIALVSTIYTFECITTNKYLLTAPLKVESAEWFCFDFWRVECWIFQQEFKINDFATFWNLFVPSILGLES